MLYNGISWLLLSLCSTLFQRLSYNYPCFFLKKLFEEAFLFFLFIILTLIEIQVEHYNMNQLFIAYIALGSNLDDPMTHLRSALLEIEVLTSTSIQKISKFYRTKPIGPDQPDIINAVIQIHTTLMPYDLLYALQAIELKHGRERLVRFGARTLDLDILLFDEIQMDDQELTIPHPRMQDRNFVLIPLQEIAPKLVLSQHGLIEDLIQKNDPEDYVIPLDVETLSDKTKPNT